VAKKKDAGPDRLVATLVDYQSTFGSPHGQRVLRHLMRMHGIMQTSYVEKDIYATIFNEGSRNVVVQILKKMQIDIRKLEEQILQTPEGDSDVII